MIAHNEERCLREALASTSFADDVVLVNCESTDRTADIAREFPHVRLFSQPNNPNLNVNKAFAMDHLTTDWIFYLDPDERIPVDLGRHIRDALSTTSHAAFRIARRNFFFGRWLRHGGQYPDAQLRLFRRGKARFPLKHVHETLTVEGSIGSMQVPFDHHPYPTLSDFLRKMNFYTDFQARFWQQEGMRPSVANVVRFLALRPANRFFRRYVLKMGFRDGWQGFMAALGDGFQTAVSFAKLLESSEHA